MCKESHDILWCITGEHQIGEKIPKRRYACHAASCTGFGTCGDVTEGKPSVLFINCCNPCRQVKVEKAKAYLESLQAKFSSDK